MAVDRVASPIGRPELALTNLLYGDVGAAARSVAAPYDLSPNEARSMAERWGIAGDSVWGPIVDTLTNPLVLLGAVLAHNFPIVPVKSLFNYSKKVQRAAKASYLPVWAQRLGSAHTIFRDVPEVTGALDDVGRYTTTFKKTHFESLRKLYDDYAKTAGKPFGEYEGFLAATRLGGLDELNPRAFKNLRVQTPFNIEAVKGEFDKAPALSQFVKGMRGWMDNLYDDVFVRHPDMRPEIVEALRKNGAKLNKQSLDSLARGEYDIPSDVRASLRNSPRAKELKKQLAENGMLEIGDYVSEYWPQRIPRDIKGFDDFVQGILNSTAGNKAVTGRQAVAGLDQTASPHLLKRAGRMAPDPRELAKHAHLLDETRFATFVDKIDKAGGTIAPYSLNFSTVLNGYANSMAATYGMNITGAGRRLKAARDAMRTAGDWRVGMLENELVPMAAGKMDVDRAVKAAHWMAAKHRFAEEVVQNSTITKVFDGLPGGKKLHQWVLERVTADEGPFGQASFSSGLTRWLGLGTLGGNIGSSVFNLMGGVMNTASLIGAEGAVNGAIRFMKGVPRYIDARKTGKAFEEAIEHAFPDYAKSGLVTAPQLYEVLGGPMERAYQMSQTTILGGKGAKMLDKAQEYLMAPFRATEAANTLIAFEGTMWRAAKEGIEHRDAIDVARKVVQTTQFPASVVNTPVVLLNKNPLLKQYMGFLLKQPEYLLQRSTSVGSGVQADRILGRNWGTLGRALLFSGLSYETGKSLGFDPTRGLISGGLPIPEEGDLFYPFPAVPPAVRIAGAVASDVLHGETTQTRRIAPALIPGGVAASRLAGMVSPSTASALRRQYVDYTQATPDGRYGVYGFSQEGGGPRLVGFATAGELIGKGLGVPFGNGLSQEPQAVKWLTSNQKRITEMKRQYMEAMQGNDAHTMQAIDDQFRRAYGAANGIGSLIRKSDYRSMQMRRNVGRLDRVLMGVPPELREQFGMALQSSIDPEAWRSNPQQFPVPGRSQYGVPLN